MDYGIRQMNERIEHITKQVDEYFDDLTIEFSREAWQAKFAELIVRECMAQCVKVEDDDELSNYEGGFRDGALLCYQEIREHFGVE